MTGLLNRLLARRHPVLDKDEWIRRYVPGLSFADIGGLWGTVNEKVTVAVRAGASSAAMIDYQPPGNKWWKLFDEHCRARGVTAYQSLRGDICRPSAVQRLGQYDFVHCSGILYHAPNLFVFLKNLHDVTRRYLVLTSIVIPGVIWNRAGRVSAPPGTLLSVPAMSEHDRKVVGRYFENIGTVLIKGINAGPAEFVAPNGRFRTGPWWWLFSAKTMRSLVALFPFDVLEDGWSWGRRSYSLLLRRR